MTGICWAALLDMDESVECWLFAVLRFARGFEGSDSYLVGETRPATDDERGGRSGLAPFSSLRDGRRWLDARVCCCGSSGSPVLPVLPCLGLPPFSEPSRPVRWRRRCCFFFRPCSRLMMMSRMRGRKLSRLVCDASWLSVS